MANPIVLPPEVILGITTVKASGIDPNDFNNAVQELFNRGYGKIGKWVQDHKDLYLQALQDGYVAEGTEVPNSEITKKNEEPPAPPVPPAPPLPHDYVPPVTNPEDAVINPEPPVETGEGFQDTPTGNPAPDDGTEPEKPDGRRKSRL